MPPETKAAAIKRTNTTGESAAANRGSQGPDSS